MKKGKKPKEDFIASLHKLGLMSNGTPEQIESMRKTLDKMTTK